MELLLHWVHSCEPSHQGFFFTVVTMHALWVKCWYFVILHNSVSTKTSRFHWKVGGAKDLMELLLQWVHSCEPSYLRSLQIGLWGRLRTKCPCQITFFHWSVTFSVCFYGDTDVASDLHCWSAGFILTTWALSLCDIGKLKLMKYIPQHMSNSWNSWFFCSISLGYHLSTAYQYYDLKQGKWYCWYDIYFQRVKYFKLLRIYSSAPILKFQ